LLVCAYATCRVRPFVCSGATFACVRVTHTRVCGMAATYPVSNPKEFSPERNGLVRDHLQDVFANKAFGGSRIGELIVLLSCLFPGRELANFAGSNWNAFRPHGGRSGCPGGGQDYSEALGQSKLGFSTPTSWRCPRQLTPQGASQTRYSQPCLTFDRDTGNIQTESRHRRLRFA
jgi:hypothetical protein